jgi:hypothetical protein
MGFTHFEYLMKATGRLQENFLLCGKVAERVRISTFRRPRNFARLEEAMDVLERHIAQAPTRSRIG